MMLGIFPLDFNQGRHELRAAAASPFVNNHYRGDARHCYRKRVSMGYWHVANRCSECDACWSLEIGNFAKLLLFSFLKMRDSRTLFRSTA